MFKHLVRDTFTGVVKTFKGKNFFWHILVYVLTFALVMSGFDWWFFQNTRGQTADTLGWLAGLIGFVVPVLIPLTLFLFAKIKKSEKLKLATIQVIQSGLMAIVLIIVYKALTGRTEPEFLAQVAINDNSRDFNFGFLMHGIFWGWPSSHTGVAFAMSTNLALNFKSNRFIGFLLISYAIFIGIGAAVSFHWFSDVISGLILGVLIGYVAYKSRFLG